MAEIAAPAFTTIPGSPGWMATRDGLYNIHHLSPCLQNAGFTPVSLSPYYFPLFISI
jgi:hypothetical protein